MLNVFESVILTVFMYCTSTINFIFAFQGFGISFSTEASQYSIFNDFTSRDLRDASNFGTFSQSCSTFASWLCQDGNCLFALATGTDVILLIKLPPPGSEGNDTDQLLTSIVQALQENFKARPRVSEVRKFKPRSENFP